MAKRFSSSNAPPKRVRRFDSVPPRPSGPTVCPVCREDLGSLQALHSHYLSCHAVRDNRLTTRPSFQCSRCSGIFGSAGGLHRHVCSSGDKLLEARQVMNAFVLKSARMPMEWFIGLVCADLRFGFLLTLLGGIGPPHNISSTCTTRIVGAAALNN